MLRNRSITRLLTTVMGFVMINFSVYLGEVDLLERMIPGGQLMDCIDDLMMQAPAEEEEQHENAEADEDIVLEHLPSAYLLTATRDCSPKHVETALFPESVIAGIETPPPRA